MPKIHIQKSLSDLSHLLAKDFVQLAKYTINRNGICNIALSGGRTPQYFFELLAKSYKDQIAWQHLHIYLTDERNVPADHPDSNYGMIKQLLLDHLAIPESQIHPMVIDPNFPKKSAEIYANKLIDVELDFVLLGIGDDGHIASLFPETSILKVKNQKAAAVFVQKLNSWRISLTFPALNAAKNISFLIAGKQKANVLQKYFSDVTTPIIYPLEMLSAQGNVAWYLDEEIAKASLLI